MADIGNLNFGVHLVDYTDAEADKIKKKLENLSVSLTIDGKNVSVSNPDSIKKQIEDAIKSVTVQSVKVDTASLATQIQNATSNITSQVKVSFLSGTLATDIQTYLDAKSFKVSISITKSQVQNEVNTAFANVSVPVTVKVSASAVIKQLKESLNGRSVPISFRARNINDFVKDLNTRLGKKSVRIDILPNQKNLLQSVKQAFKNNPIKAQVDVNVDASAITRAVQSAINNASFTYNPNGGRRNNANATANAQRNLGNSYRYAGNEASQSARASVTLGRAMATNIKIAGELGTALGNIASVFKAKDILEGVVTIGGQLENQRIALGAILQDGGKAVEMFSKIQSLAVKSPFGIMDLNQYTKQLAAYGIEYNELYDTMRRMADISAGVGVDMGRIILAFGQVRAAGFLKGTELRQFTEANIPMVEKLAERFSILEKRIVSAGEVYDMISEKKIAFEDVKAVLWDLTGEGGMFNNMQEVLSESLASKWKNLSDAIDIMYGKMSDGFIGRWLKTFAEGLTELTKNWEYVGAAIGAATTSYIAYKTAMLLGGRQLQKTRNLYNEILADKRKQADNLRLTKTFRDLTKAEKNLISTTDRLTVADIKRQIRLGNLNKDEVLHLINLKKLDQATLAYVQRLYQLDAAMVSQAQKSGFLSRAWISLGNALRGVTTALWSVISSPWTWITGAITLVAELWAGAEKKQAEIKQRNDEVLQSAKGSAEALEKELQKLDGLDLSKLNADEIKSKLKDLTEVIKNEAFGWQSILSEIFAQNADGTFVNSAMEQLKLLQEKMEELAIAKKNLTENNEIYSEANDATKFGGNDIIDAVKNYNKRIEENDKKLRDLAIHAREVGRAISFATENNELLQKSMRGKSLVEQIAILREYEEEWNLFVNEIRYTNTKAYNIIDKWNRSLVDKTAYGVWGAEEVLLHKFRQAKGAITESFMLNGEDLSNLSESARQTILGYVNLLIKEGGVQKKRLQQFFFDWWTENTDIDYVDLGYIVPPQITGNDNKTEYDESKDEVAKMWKRRAEEIEKAVKMYDQWKKVEGTVKAQSRVKGNEELASLFSGAYGFNLDLENPTKAYEYIQGKLNEKLSAQKKLKIELGVKISDAELKDAQDKLKSSLEQIKKETDKIVEGWNLYEDLFKATGNKQVSMEIAFGGNVSFKDKLSHLKSEIKEKMSELGVGISFEDLIKMDTKQLEAGGFTALSGLIETYNKETTKVKEESVKNFIDIINRSKDFSEQIVEIERKLQKDLEDLNKNAEGYTPEQIAKKQSWLKKEAEQAKVKVQFEEFKEGSNWVKVFDDLDRVSDATLDSMISGLEKFAAQAHLSEDITKQLVEAMRKLREESIDRNPFEGFKYAKEDLSRLRNAIKGKDVNGNTIYMVAQKDGSTRQMSQQEYDDEFKEVNDTVTDSILAIADKFDAVAQAADFLGGMFDSLGIDMNGFLGTLSGVLTGTASGAKTGADISKKLGLGGAWGAAAGAAIGAITSISQAHDKKLDVAIEESKQKVKELGYAYENLEGIIEWQLGGVTDKQATEMLDNLNQQVYELYEQRKLEEEKKKTDPAKVADYTQQIHKAEEAVRDFYANLANEQYGVDIKSWASDIASALTDAFASGEDAAQAFDNTVGGILKSLATEAIRMQFIEPAMNNLRSFLFDSNSGIFAKNSLGGTHMTDIEAGRLAEELNKLKGQIEASNDFWDEINEATGGLLDETEKASSGLTGEIKGVTEDTANLLASYLNATRQDVSVNRTLLEQLVGSDVPKMNYLAEAQLQQLQMVVANTKRNADTADKIYSLIDRVVDKGGNRLKI